MDHSCEESETGDPAEESDVTQDGSGGGGGGAGEAPQGQSGEQRGGVGQRGIVVDGLG
ncbi:hypothetical protein ACIBG6_31460 [Streptomyces sp. NPDC050842]|uniref:hypothetical protein n=1 Tax=Streptomyces sp. NPDC050842 TaxID=3365636 RepID=UPI0037A12520